MSPKELVDNILGFTAKTSYTLSRTCIKIFNNITHNSHGFVDAIYFYVKTSYHNSKRTIETEKGKR